MSLFSLENKRALLIGSSGNLGPIWEDILWTAGAQVDSWDYPEQDIRYPDSIDKAARIIVTTSGIPNIIVYNAALDNPPNSESTFFKNFSRIIDTNLSGAANVYEVFIPHMIRNGGGVVVNIGSIAGSVGVDPTIYPDSFEKPVGYNCSKAALAQLSRSITTQYGRYNIRSVTISFAGIDNPSWTDDFRVRYQSKIPLKRTPSKESLQQTLLYACCCREVAGTEIICDGGYLAL